MKNRQLELLIHLLEHKKSTLPLLAKHFEVSTKTIGRDIDRLSSMGIPVFCQQGVGGGISIDENYTFSNSFFTPEDIYHMVTALHITRNFTSNPQNMEILHKLTLINPSLTKLFEENVNQHFFIDLYNKPTDFNSDIFLHINQCLDLKLYSIINVQFKVVPISYVYKSDGVHLFCYYEGYKVLKIADIQSFEPTTEEYSGEYITYNEFKNKFETLS